MKLYDSDVEIFDFTGAKFNKRKENNMNILSFIKNWKDFSTIWSIIQPFILKLIKKNVPTTITKLYENLAKYTQPAIDSLFKLKGKIQNSPNELDDYCFNQGVDAIESFANYLLETVKTLRT